MWYFLFIYFFSAVSLAQDFQPQFRWQGVRVAENHEKPAEAESPARVIDSIESGIRVDDIIEPPAAYRYSSFSKRDPFAYPDRELFADDEFTTNKLQHYNISSLKLVGIWRLENGISRALILTPTSEGVVVTIGDPVGHNNGEVLEIGRQKIIVREYILTPDGTRQFNDTEMLLEKFIVNDLIDEEEDESTELSDTSLDKAVDKAVNKAVSSVVKDAIESGKISGAAADTSNTSK